MPPEVWPPRAHPLGFGSGKLTWGEGGGGFSAEYGGRCTYLYVYCIVGNFARFKVCSFCDLAEFMKFSVSEIFFTKRYKEDFEQNHKIFPLHTTPYMSTHTHMYVCALSGPQYGCVCVMHQPLCVLCYKLPCVLLLRHVVQVGVFILTVATHLLCGCCHGTQLLRSGLTHPPSVARWSV